MIARHLCGTTQPFVALPSTPIQHHLHTLRVYWEDTDAGGVVFYANYLKFFERARTEWLRALGFQQHDMAQRLGVMFVVSDTQVRYVAPARLDDEVTVSVQVVEAGRASLAFLQQASCGDRHLAEGRIRIGCVACMPDEHGAFRVRRIPTEILSALGDVSPLA